MQFLQFNLRARVQNTGHVDASTPDRTRWM